MCNLNFERLDDNQQELNELEVKLQEDDEYLLIQYSIYLYVYSFLTRNKRIWSIGGKNCVYK